MARLTPAQLTSRLAFDYRAMMALEGASLGRIRAFASESAWRRNHELTPDDGLQGKATVYTVDYAFRVLSGPGVTVPSVTARFSLLSSTNYPYHAPNVVILSKPLPWSPHVHPSTGIVCIGDFWHKAKGHTLNAHLVGHVARMLNWDEPDRGDGYEGWNAAAIHYWRTTMGRSPLIADLVYPNIPVHITHPVNALETADVFTPLDPLQTAVFEPTADLFVASPAFTPLLDGD